MRERASNQGAKRDGKKLSPEARDGYTQKEDTEVQKQVQTKSAPVPADTGADFGKKRKLKKYKQFAGHN
ncbi:hypothetical protein MASR1M90_15240 [Desulfovibrionales bacterium]